MAGPAKEPARPVRRARALAVVFFACYAVASTYPGLLPFARVRPFVLGLPFAFAWVSAWIVAGGLVLWAVDRVARRAGPEA